MKKFLRKKYLIIAIAVVVLFLIGFYRQKTNSFKADSIQAISSADQKNLPEFTKEELGKYNGTDPKLPIYLVLDGNVYDVSKGSEFYKVGGPYHFLAGKDSSLELHLVGGDIIKRKYPVVGKFANTD